VFLKGCPLRCRWCHSPETQSPDPEILLYRDRCIRCGSCVEYCEAGAAFDSEAGAGVDRSRCLACGSCTVTCPAGARELAGIAMTPDEVMREVLKDQPFYDESGGGVTLSGGEPLLQPAFVETLLDRCHASGIPVAIETCGFVNPLALRHLARRVELFLYDLKLMDDHRHRRATGVSNRRILVNLRDLAAHGPPIVVRIPLVPGVNDDEDNISAIGAFVSTLGISRIDLLPYHRGGIAKYERLDREYPLPQAPAVSVEAVTAAAALLAGTFGLDVRDGSGGKL
jgi:pyruvate formate lyase activating enzyme